MQAELGDEWFPNCHLLSFFYFFIHAGICVMKAGDKIKVLLKNKTVIVCLVLS